MLLIGFVHPWKAHRGTIQLLETAPHEHSGYELEPASQWNAGDVHAPEQFHGVWLPVDPKQVHDS